MNQNIAEDLRSLARPIGSVKPDPRNARKHPKRSIDALCRALERFGQRKPIVVRDGVVIAGNGTLEAAARLDWREIACVEFKGSDDEARAYAIADNRTAELSGWDKEILADSIGELIVGGWDELGDDVGFSEAELARLRPVIDGDEREDEAEIDEPDELLEKWGVKPGDLWVAGEQRVLCGDSRDARVWQLLLGDERATWLWTDPPYGVEYQGGTKKKLKIKNDDAAGLPALLKNAFSTVNEYLTEGASIYVSTPATALSVEFALAFIAAGWKLHQNLVWMKDALVLGHSDYHYRHEPILYGRKPGPGKWGRGSRGWYGDDAQTSVLEHKRPRRSSQHPTMKPVSLVEQCLRNCSQKGDLGLEPFAGSGTTLVAAQNLGRRCAATELDPKYVAVCLERLAALGLSPERV